MWTKSFSDWINEAKRPKWHDSDAPDANGRFRDLGVKALAKWLISSRKGDMRKITGSLNQQIVFNRGKDPAYAKKMEKVRAEVKRQLGKNESWDHTEWDRVQKAAADRRRLEELGMRDSILGPIKEAALSRRWKVVGSDDSVDIELTRWEPESTYLARIGARHQKKYPNTYHFSVTENGAEEGEVRILWYSSKDSVKEEVMSGHDPMEVIWKIQSLFDSRRVD